MSNLNQYRKLSDREHVRARFGVYGGSKYNTNRETWIIDSSQMKLESNLEFNPGVQKLFDEILSNSVDEHIRSGKVNNIWVDLHQLTGEIVVRDDGGIPVALHPEHKQWIPEMIFTELRAGSNFDDSNRTTAGTNGMGSSIVAVMSDSFSIRTCDGKKEFSQTYTNGLESRTDPSIKNSSDNGTTITFIPDYEYFGTSLDDGNYSKMVRRVYDAAACNPKVKFFLNGKKIDIKSFKHYSMMFSDTVVHESSGDWEISIATSPDSMFRQISFVNGIDTYEGGTHVDYIVSQITTSIREFIKKKHKVDVKPNIIKQQMMLVMKCVINAPEFTSQTKENMISEVRNFGSSYTPSPTFIKKILSSDVIQKVLDWVEGERRRIELTELRRLNKETQNSGFLKKITKFDDATSRKRDECVLVITEGDSAASTIISARDPKKHGVFPLRGKMMNVRGVDVKKITSNEEIKNLLAIIGLKIGQEVPKMEDGRWNVVEIDGVEYLMNEHDIL